MAPNSRQRCLPGIEPDFADSVTPDPPLDEASTTGSGERRATPIIQDRTCYAVDAHSLIYQVFHALPEMTSPSGEVVNAVYGFAKDMLFLIEEKQPEVLVCAFDRPGPTFRHALFDLYKADRAEMPDDLKTQLPKIRRLLAALGIPILERDGYEADDILATFARHIEEAGGRCMLVTADKDCRQLITNQVQLYNIRKDQILDADALQKEWGIRPDQVVDFQALVGDKIDNIPGIPLIGPKIAAELLNQYGTLERILDHADQIKQGKRRQNLIDYRDQALLSRQLVALDRNVPLELDWNAAHVGGYDPDLLGQLSAEFGFRALGERLAALGGSQARLPTWEADYQLIHSPEKLLWLARELAKQSVVSIDTETTHISPRWADLVGLSFAWRPGEAFYVPLRGPSNKEEANGNSSCGESNLLQAPSKPRVQEPLNPFGMAPDEILDILRPVLENPAIAKIGQNLKYDIVVLRGAGIRVQGIVFDTMVAAYLLDAGTRTHSLDDLSRRFLDHSPIQIEDLIGKGKAQKRMDTVPVDQVAEYAAEDADIPLRLFPILNRSLEQEDLGELNASVEVPLIGVLAEMEFNGIRVDTDRLAVLSRRFGEKADMLAAQIEELAGHPLNIDSPKQLAQVLFHELGLPVIKKTKTGPSTNVLVLEELAFMHPLPAKIMEYRQFTKLKNTYVDALPDLVHPETGRVHASFNQVVAATGRLSSSDPNLQNIPVRTEEGRAIRSAFTAGPPGWKLLAADYSQIELRILAHYCGDATLQAAFEEDQDIHTLVASQVYHVPGRDVTQVQRRSAKAVNFGILYGQSAFGLSKSLGIPLDEAAAFIDAYFARYPGVDRFFAETLHACHEQAHVRTILGRRRSITGVRPVELLKVRDGRFSARQFNFAERTALNTVIQGSAADLIKLAMLAVYRQLTDEELAAKMLLQIHDELVFEAPEEELHRLACLVRTSMIRVLSLKVPLKVDIKTGSNWADCEAYD